MQLDISRAYVEVMPQIKGVIYLYALIDPRDNQVRYVGQTRQRLKERYRQHIWSYHSMEFVEWAAEVILSGHTIKLALIAPTTPENAFKDEQALMRVATKAGHHLLNIRDHRPSPKLRHTTVANYIDTLNRQ